MEFAFRITQYDPDDLEDEVAVALEKQLELNSRKRLPAIWRFIDRSNSRRVAEGVIRKRSILRKIYGIIMTVMGILLLVPGLINPNELLIPLITGIISLITGLGCMWPWRRRSNRRFRIMAKKILAGMRKPLDETSESSLLVRFTPKGMSLPNNTLIMYQDFQSIIETENIYFLVWRDKVTILQKKDLQVVKSEEFLTFLEEMTSLEKTTVVTGE